MTQALFRSVLFSFQVFTDFPVVFLLSICSLIPSLLKNTLYNFYSLKFVEVCFVAQDMFYLGICSMNTSKECYFLLLLGGIFYKILDKSCGLIVLCVFRSSLTFCLVVLPIVERGVLKSPTVILYLPVYPFSSVSFS